MEDYDSFNDNDVGLMVSLAGGFFDNSNLNNSLFNFVYCEFSVATYGQSV